jgi:hypothetical protein
LFNNVNSFNFIQFFSIIFKLSLPEMATMCSVGLPVKILLYMCVYIYICVCVCVCERECINTHTHTYMYVCIYI